MSNRKWWIDKKDEFINQFNSGKSGKELAEYFKVSESSITRAISDLNLRIRLVSEGDFKGYKIDWSDKKEELEKYVNEDKLSLYEISKKFNTSEGSIRRAIKKLEIKRVNYKTGNRVFASVDDVEFSKIVSESKSIAEVLKKLGYQPLGGNYRTCQNRINKLNLDTTHFTGKLWNKGLKGSRLLVKSTKDILNNSTSFKGSYLKERLISQGLKKYECEKCHNTEWNGQPIPLQIHHIDGNHFNNSLDNLQILCPNCHAQTDNFCGKNIIGKYSVSIPDKDELLQKYEELKSINDVSSYYQVSNTTLRKWINELSISDKWNKIKNSIKGTRKP